MLALQHDRLLSQWQKSDVTHSYYQKKLAEGKPRKAAIRCLQRRLVDNIYIFYLIQLGYLVSALLESLMEGFRQRKWRRTNVINTSDK